MSTSPADAALTTTTDGETTLYAAHPDWRAYPGLTVLGFLLAVVGVGLVLLAVAGVRKRSLSWKITSRRIELTHGWLSRNISTVELWRVEDVEFQQGLMQRILGVASLSITTRDERNPRLLIPGVPGDRAGYDRLMNAVMAARQTRGVMNLNS